MVYILVTDTPEEMAIKIYKHFLLDQSCVIEGLTREENNLVPIGFIVMKKIKEFDEIDNFTVDASGRMRRRRRVQANSIGGHIANKVFRYNEEVDYVNRNIRWTFWRVQ